MTIRLVLADDHAIFLDGLEGLLRLEPDFEVVGRYTSGEDALRAVLDLAPDILVLDLRMPDMDGLEVLRRLVQERTSTHVVLFTAGLDEDDVLEAIPLGVRGVVLKEMPPRLLLECLRKVHAGERWLERQSTAQALDKLLQREAGRQEASAVLTRREIEVARMAAGGISNREIAGRLSVTEGTVKVHVHSIYVKLGVRDRRALVRWVQERGLL